ncbi:MAG: hypothetical protein NC253_01340 [Ruminococcus sp.]|nr:hypothetical protein [Ruminococcus sp.]MCM1380931.1 hypothetical protein [Muribaculaceae bacterium]MCM1480484.1 hypothetical protein [Muribaculaceae bacterium]
MDFLDKIGMSISEIFSKLLDALPKSPITYIETTPEINKILSYVNYFIPISTMIALAEAWLLVIAVYYAYQLILRWIKMIE